MASKSLDVKLNWKERWGLKLHLLMCRLCRRYLHDLKRMRMLMNRFAPQQDTLLNDSVKLSEQSRERIKQSLDKAEADLPEDTR